MSHTRHVGVAFQLVLLISLLDPVFAGDVAGWRTDGTRSRADADHSRTWSDQKNVAWKTELPGRSHSSPVVSGNRVLAGCDDGETSVMKAGGDFGELARNRCEGYSSCPVFAGKRAFLRTKSHLYCISEAGT